MQLRGGVRDKFQKENSDRYMKSSLRFPTFPTNTAKWYHLVVTVVMCKFPLKNEDDTEDLLLMLLHWCLLGLLTSGTQ